MPTDPESAYLRTRRFTEKLCEPLEVEDYVVQAMPDASPVRWHLAHTTWFFETFVLRTWETRHQPVNPYYQTLFNSYYNSIGEQFPRAMRGVLTRPTVAEVFAYRHEVDERILCLLNNLPENQLKDLGRIVEIGIQHEQQHQELILTDLKYLFSCNPLSPVYTTISEEGQTSTGRPSSWKEYAGGVVAIGHQGNGFSFDNENPRHQTLLQPYLLQNRLVTAGEFLEFINDGGYERSELWLSLGWSVKQEQGWKAPLYWEKAGADWNLFTLNGLRPLALGEPVCHISYFEAEAYARWADARLPTEAEWEHAATETKTDTHVGEPFRFHPSPWVGFEQTPGQWYGEVWQWTASPYIPYPGYRAPSGALGEYNGKFMCNQYVLRGGSCVTPPGHTRPTYRNFFPPDARWQFSGLRLARDSVR